MAEVVLRTNTRRGVIGSIVDSMSNSALRRKWLEYTCDFPAPYKRNDPAFQKIPGWNRIVQMWDDTPGLREAWLLADKPNPGYPTGELLMNVAKPQSLWREIIEPTGILTDIGFAPESDMPAYNTFLWGNQAKRDHLIIFNEDDVEGVQNWKSEERIVDFEKDLDISGATLDSIMDPTKVVHVRYDKPVSKTVAKIQTMEAI